MKRSSSKLITRARSVRNMGKVPFKFKFDLFIETVEKLAPSGDIVVVWERNGKAEATKAAKIDKSTRKASFANERISSEITLFKTQPSERRFQDKVFKIAVKSGDVEGRTLGKIHLNLADYAEVPSGSKRISAELTNGAILIASIQCAFLSMGKATAVKPGSKNDADEGLDDDDVDNELESDGAGDSEAPTSFLKNKFSAKITRAASKKTISRQEKKSHKDDENSSSVSNGASDPTSERLRKENVRLRKQLEEAERSAGSGSGGSGAGDGKLEDENRSLRSEVKDLKRALAREPVYADVVRELKEAKMALALLHLEKEEVTLELMKFQRGALTANKR